MEKDHKDGVEWMSYFMNCVGILICMPIFIFGAECSWRKCGFNYKGDYPGYSDWFHNLVGGAAGKKDDGAMDYEKRGGNGPNQIHAEEKLTDGKDSRHGNYGAIMSDDRGLDLGNNPTPLRTDERSFSGLENELSNTKPVEKVPLRETTPVQATPAPPAYVQPPPQPQKKEAVVENYESGDIDAWGVNEKPVGQRESSDKLNMSENRGLVE